MTDPNLREGEEPAAGAEVEALRPVLPPLPVTALELQGDEVATLPPALGPVPPVEVEAEVLAEEVEEAPFLDTEAEPDWQEAGTAELHRLHGGAEDDEGVFVGSGDWEPEEEAEAELGFEPAEEVPPPEESAEEIADLAALDGVDELVAGMLAEAGEAPDDNVFVEPGALEAWVEEGRAEALAEAAVSEAAEPEVEEPEVEEPAAEAEPEAEAEPTKPTRQPVAAVAPRQGDLWSAAGVTAPPVVAPPPRGADLLVEDADDLLDVDLASVLPALARLRAASPEGLVRAGARAGGPARPASGPARIHGCGGPGAGALRPFEVRFPACPRPETRYVSAASGRSAVWLARPSGGREVESSNLSGPTITEPPACRMAARAVPFPKGRVM